MSHTSFSTIRNQSLIFAVTLLSAIVLPMLSIPMSAQADGSDCTPGPTPPPSHIVQADSAWLNGSGVNICYNGSSGNVWGTNYVNGVQSGSQWQCVELVNRLYLTKGWTTARWPGN